MPNSQEHFLACLNELKQETDRFASILHSNAENASLLKSKFSFDSSIFILLFCFFISHSLKDSSLNDLLFKLVQQLYFPYRNYSSEYTNNVIKYLQHHLDTNIKLVI